MRSLFVVTLLGAASCAGPDLGDLTKEQSMTVYQDLTTELRNVHSIVLSSRPLPQTYDYSCATGTIELRISQDAMMEPARLRHEIKGCAMQDLTIDGEVEYGSLSPCEGGDGTFAFTIGAIVDIGGAMDGFCYIEAHDDCGPVTGNICGFTVDSIDP